MKKILYALLGLIVFMIPTMPQAQSDIIFRPGPGLNDGTDNGSLSGGKDAQVSGYTPDTNDGASSNLVGWPISNCNPAAGKAYIQFDLSTLPANVEQVFLGVTHEPHTSYCLSNCDADFYFYPVTEPWDEMTITYNSMPTEGVAVYGPINITFPNDFGNREYDITDIYRSWKNNFVPNYGLAIHSPTVGCSNACVIFNVDSSDHPEESRRPYLRIITAAGMTFSDNFNDNKKSTVIWGKDTVKGNGILTERNRRLEYSVSTSTAEDSYKRLLNARGPYNANWEAQIDLYNNTSPSQSGRVNSFGIDMYHCEDPDDWVYAELYASTYVGPVIKGFHAEFATDDGIPAWLDTGDLAGSSSLSGSVRIAFDSDTKIVSLSYSYSGGGWVPLGTFGISGMGGGADGNGNWAMTDTDQFCLKVYGYSERMKVTGGTMYGDNFVATGMVPSRVTLIDPNGAEILPAGEEYPITWGAPSDNEKFTLKYSMDGGSTWETIATGVSGTSYPWPVPVPGNNKRKCLVKVIGYNASNAKMGTDVSDSPFTIEVLKLDAPNGGGEPLISETQFPITWTTSKYVTSVDNRVQLSFTLDNGATWKTISTTEDPSDDGSFLWTVPKVRSEKKNCKVKIVLKSASGKTLGSDTSDSVFTIQPGLP